MTRPTTDLSRLKAALTAETQARWRDDARETQGWSVKAIRSTAAIVALSGAAAAGLAVSAPAMTEMAAGIIAPKSEIDFRVGRNASMGRLEIYGSVGSRASVRSEKGQVVIRLPGQKTPDIGDFRANPPMGVTAVALRQDSRASEIVMTLAEGAKARFGRSDGAVYVQIETKDVEGDTAKLIMQQAGETPSASASSSASEQAPAKTTYPVVALKHVKLEDGVQIDFPFPDVTGAAVFRRGEAVWMVFDKEVDFRLPPTLKDGVVIEQANWARNDGFTALRLIAPAGGSLSVDTEGALWRVRIGGKALDAPLSEVAVKRDDTSGAATLTLNLAGARKVAWIRDPMVGDRIAVVTAPGPVKAVRDDRSTVQASIGSTAQGVMIERMAPDVTVTLDGDRVAVTRPGGLLMSSDDNGTEARTIQTGYRAALFPTAPDASWSETPPDGFLKKYNALQVSAAEEQGLGAEGPYTARLDLARFLVGQGMNFEAQGVLDLLGKTNPRSLGDPQMRGLRVVAKVLSGRLTDAQADLDSTALISDPAANLWRGYIAQKTGHYEEARKAFAAGAPALDGFPPQWRTRFATANAQAALATKDLASAAQIIGYAVTQDVQPLDRLEAQLVQAEIIEAQGDKRRALRVYTAIAKSTSDRLNTPAQMRAARLKLELGEAKPDETLATMNALRFRWRGDDTELELIRTVGDIYLTQGRYREALEVLKSGGMSFFSRPEAVEINQKLNAAFRSLFLDGMADGLQPVEALGLFNDFRDLTPVGADGDLMVRRMARRLVEVDLLSQAADLLDYQVENRLQGVAKSQVAADLAAIHLMNRQPEKALQAIWKTRTTLLPKAVMAERRVLEARALNDLNRTDNALEVLGTDMSPEALDVRADIYWRQKDWVKAGALLEKRLGERWKKDGNLSLAEEANLIRAGVAYSLASDQKSLDRLSQRFGKFADTAQNGDAMRVALAGLDNGPLRASDFAMAAAQTDSFTGWVASMKQKFREQGKTPAAPAPAQQAQAPAAAPAPKKA
ncbi:tetratricopeptide repeat protein [Asticcacaulis sp. BYS171W]|uniref:Tetratricopeptide repeat protein n=1 Tax=Asticcacaulis aquaticus TaxID=2984212 RepID=A0ABT5HV91_9CAUL|nr:tetratricopeptide repeat protein [Asticcacaulis aquaticus]MDC7683974.1 tetratricopeptide repeat protein [Asticcacaulis aquaticus]